MMRASAEIILMGAHFITAIREAYSPAEVCDLCSFGLTTLYAEIKAGRLRARIRRTAHRTATDQRRRGQRDRARRPVGGAVARDRRARPPYPRDRKHPWRGRA